MSTLSESELVLAYSSDTYWYIPVVAFFENSLFFIFWSDVAVVLLLKGELTALVRSEVTTEVTTEVTDEVTTDVMTEVTGEVMSDVTERDQSGSSDTMVYTPPHLLGNLWWFLLPLVSIVYRVLKIKGVDRHSETKHKVDTIKIR